MQIHIQKNLKAFKEKYPDLCKGVKVNDYEKLNIQFPLSYKEFLFLCGDEFEPLRGLNLGFYPVNDNQLWILKQNENARKNLKEYGLAHLMPKNWWVVAEWDGSEVIWYIDLDADDDPPVYGFNIVEYAYEPSDFWHKKVADSFSEWINKKIDFFEKHGHS